MLCCLTCFEFLWFCLGLVPLYFALFGGFVGGWFAMGFGAMVLRVSWFWIGWLLLFFDFGLVFVVWRARLVCGLL